MFEFSVENYKFDLLMKVDDDTFINPYSLGEFFFNENSV